MIIVLAVVGGVILFVYTRKQIQEWEQRIEQKGDLLLCWIASADDTLHQEYDVPGYADARVVFSPTAMPDLEEQLKEASRRLMKGDIVDQDVDPDKIDPSQIFFRK